MNITLGAISPRKKSKSHYILVFITAHFKMRIPIKIQNMGLCQKTSQNFNFLLGAISPRKKTLRITFMFS